MAQHCWSIQRGLSEGHAGGHGSSHASASRDSAGLGGHGGVGLSESFEGPLRKVDFGGQRCFEGRDSWQ
eukprot:symbB.v1.2.023726.t1/scaffold2194.1/size86169/3